MQPNEKKLEIIKKLFATAAGAKDENASPEIINEAMAALTKARELCLKYKVEEADFEQKSDSPTFIPVFGTTIVQNNLKRFNKKVSKREIWWEELAKVVAEGYFCKVGILEHENSVKFYGLDLDREVAIFMFNNLAELANNICKIEMKKAKETVGLQGFDFKTGKVIEALPEWIGDDVFYESFHFGFREKIAENYLKQQNESDEHSREVFEKSHQEVAEFFQNKAHYSEQRENYTETFVNEFAREIGLKAGERTTNNISNITKSQTLAIKKAIKNTFGEVYILLDTSGSMYGERIDQAKAGAYEYAKVASEKGHSVGVIVFNSGAKRIIEPIKKVNGFFEEELTKVRVMGSTKLHLGIEIAKSYFKTSRIERTIMIITDGEPDSEFKALEAATEAKKSGINIAAIGTDGADKEFLDKLCSMESIRVDPRKLREGIVDMARLLSEKT